MKQCIVKGCTNQYLASGYCQIHFTDNYYKNMQPEKKHWLNIRRRCLYGKNNKYSNRYIERGIIMYKGWTHDFDAFFKHIGEKPSPLHTVDRIDNNKGYIPGNVRWATRKEQANNRSTNKIVLYKGKTYTLAQLSDECGVSQRVLSDRIIRGMTIEDAVTTPLRAYRKTIDK